MPLTGHLSFSGGAEATSAIGQTSKVRFAFTWADGDTWSIPFTTTLTGDFTLGLGNIAGQNFTHGINFRDRVYVGIGTSFALSAVGDETGWEEQNPGAGVISYISQYGNQDSVQTFASLQGRLAVFGAQSIQMWDTDSNPGNFALQQTMDNTGTRDPLSVQSIGDLDVMFLDQSGIRSLRAKESTLNAYINDIGTAIDLMVRADLQEYTAGEAVAIIEPTTRQYWLWLNDKIYVLSYYPQSKVTAWSTYKATYVKQITPTYVPTPIDVTGYTIAQFGSDFAEGEYYYWEKGTTETHLADDGGTTLLTASGVFRIAVFGGSPRVYGPEGSTPNGSFYRLAVDFVPQKFVVYNNQIYVKAEGNKVYRYGGSDNATFDRSRLIAELPWLTLDMPSQFKQFLGLDCAIAGSWTFYMSANPQDESLTEVLDRGGAASPSMTEDSTYDVGHFGYSGHGTHVKVRAESFDDAEAKLGKLALLYQPSNVK